MSILIKKVIEKIDEKKAIVEAIHCGSKLHLYLLDESRDITTFLNTEVSFETDYEEINSWLIIKDFNDDNSGLFERDGNILIRGRIHNMIDMDGDTIIDIYIMNGPEFISILSSEINGIIPRIDEGVEIRVRGLCIYPVHY